MLLLFLLLLLLLLLQFFCSNEPGPQGKWRKRAQGLDWSLKGHDACAIATRSITVHSGGQCRLQGLSMMTIIH